MTRIVALLVCLALVGCSWSVGVHYVDGQAACRVWQGRAVVKGETLVGCIVPQQDPPRGETVAMITVKGWQAESTGGDVVGTSSGEGVGLNAERESETRTTGPGELTLPVAGASGIVIASRDDDTGQETASMVRTATIVWGWVKSLGELAKTGIEALRR